MQLLKLLQHLLVQHWKEVLAEGAEHEHCQLAAGVWSRAHAYERSLGMWVLARKTQEGLQRISVQKVPFLS